MARKKPPPATAETLEAIQYEEDPNKRRSRTGLEHRVTRAMRRAHVQTLAAQKMRAGEIAEATGIPERTVYKDLAWCQAYHLRGIHAARNEALELIKAECAQLKIEMRRAWEKSKRGKRVIKTGVPLSGGEGAGEGGMEVTTYESPGDPAYIEKIIKLNDQTMKALDMQIDPRHKNDLKMAPPLHYLVCQDREDVALMSQALTVEQMLAMARKGQLVDGDTAKEAAS